MSKFIGILVSMLALGGVAQAGSDDHDRDYHRHHHQVPEIVAAGAAGALTLLAGGLAIMRGRRKKK
jgi:hypothetical protein